MEKEQKKLEIWKIIEGTAVKIVKFLKPVSPKEPPPPPKLTGTKALVVDVVQCMGNSIVICSLMTICILRLIFFRSHYPEIILTCCFNAGLIVANILVATLRQPVIGDVILSPDQCKAAHLAIFYAYTVAYTMGIMLSRQICYIRGAFRPKGWQLSFFFNVWFSVMIPTLPTWGLAILFWVDNWYDVRFVTEASCMGDLSSNWSRFYFPFLFFVQLAPTAINLETGAKYEAKNRPLVGQDFRQRKVAQRASWALIVVMCFSMAGQVLTIFSTYTQSLFLTTVVFGMNVATAIIAFFMQLRLNCEMEETVLRYLRNVLRKLRRR